ncbi:MAG TPA: M20/M25/M40 family metallo-hydrolase [Thermoanaerobaculia bacterium]|nr:M20/M25/M40 family metallo-hydrolase [Thermoanaerobaculia bacterium]
MTFRALLLTPLLVSAAATAGTLHAPGEVHLTEVRQLTFGGENAEASWSFDGRRLSFQSTRPPYACDQIFTLDPFGGGEPALVSTGQGRTTCAHFLLGDQRVVYASTDAYASECPPPPDFSQGYVWPIDPDYELFVSDPDGGNRVRLTENRAYDAEATVCAIDGTIVFTSTRDGDLELYTMKPDGSEVKRLTHAPGYDGGAFFSADCSKIVWRASRPRGEALEDYQSLLANNLVRPSKLEIWVAEADGTEARRVTDLGAASFAPYFFPDARRIIFSSNYGSAGGREFDLWAIDVDGTDLERITFTEGFDGFPMFSPDGKLLVFGSNRNQGEPGETDVYLARWVEADGEKVAGRAADRFAADAAWLAADEREGRGVGTAGIDGAGAWIEQRFRELGLEPAGSDGYRQPFEVTVEIRSEAGTSLSLDGEAVDAAEFVPLAFSSPGPVEADVVYAGWGIVAPELGRDDYEGLDVEGKIVLVRRFVPSTEEFREGDAERRYSGLRHKTFNARERGAVGLLVADVLDPEADSQDESPLPRLKPDEGGDAGIPAMAITRALADRLIESGASARMAVELAVEKATTFNVAGRLEPAGEVAADGEAIVVGAHYDHLGHGGGGSMAPDSTEIHNGADDNASGTVAMLEIARRLAERRGELRRPVVFVAFSGEERGLLGSSWLVNNPPPGLEPERVAAMLNLDMVGRLRDDTVTVFGSDSAEEWAEILDPACEASGLTCKTSGDGYGPSDQTSFYAAGVPVLHFFTGTHDQYHRPSDDADLLYAVGGAAVAGLTADVALRLDQRATPPTLKQSESGPPPSGDTRGLGASLGTIPDFAGLPEGQTGMPVAGTRPGGPADAAGIRRGDVIVELGGQEIRDIHDLMFVLRKATPGERVVVVVVRDGDRVELEAVYGEPRRRN